MKKIREKSLLKKNCKKKNQQKFGKKFGKICHKNSSYRYTKVTQKLKNIVLGVIICKNHVAKPKCRKIILSCRETFFCRNLKNDRMSFCGQCNVDTASRPGI